MRGAPRRRARAARALENRRLRIRLLHEQPRPARTIRLPELLFAFPAADESWLKPVGILQRRDGMRAIACCIAHRQDHVAEDRQWPLEPRDRKGFDGVDDIVHRLPEHDQLRAARSVTAAGANGIDEVVHDPVAGALALVDSAQRGRVAVDELVESGGDDGEVLRGLVEQRGDRSREPVESDCGAHEAASSLSAYSAGSPASRTSAATASAS